MSNDEKQSNSTIQEMREAIERKDDKIGELETQLDELQSFKRDTVISGVLEEFGLTPDKGAGKLVRSSYDGDLDTEAVTDWLTEQGFEPGTAEPEGEQPEGLESRAQQQSELSKIREAGEASSGSKVDFAEWKQIVSTDPQRAMQLKEQGRVDMPASVAQPR